MVTGKGSYSTNLVSFSQGHINNCIYNKYAETARVNWFMKLATAAPDKDQAQWLDLVTPKSIGLIMKSITAHYKMPITYPDSITVLHKFASAPRHDMHDFTLKALIFSHKDKRIAATFTETITPYDYRLGSKCLLDKQMIDIFAQTYAAQEHHRAKVTRLLQDIEELIHDVQESGHGQAP
ncbi:hypothetical protein CDD82_3629 [Ophiocordyceps australis]|uniref:Uncharacterized protein n=1 Tax=Ophiocordyceps australis TaxID=1399860 RepID=A0A2C5ZUH3_9HYPO|nr:hypothetical protein CDD82_3629 [Ophiocordyceps australis]